MIAAALCLLLVVVGLLVAAVLLGSTVKQIASTGVKAGFTVHATTGSFDGVWS